jgi:hypothetical protein
LNAVKDAEAKLDMQAMVEVALSKTEILNL